MPLGVTRTYVKQVEVGLFPAVRRHFQVTRCNQCDSAPCVAICPVTAMYRRPDGIVDFDTSICIGCKACMAACPYDAIFISPETRAAEKCNFCAHRIDQGLEPACVVVCPEEAIIVGNLNDPQSLVSRYLGREKLAVRKPEKGTQPKVLYKEASDFTLSPTAAGYAGMHLWSEQHEGYPVQDHDPSRYPGAPLVAYDVPHKRPWGWMVSAYTWTKSIAAGSFGVLSALYLAGIPFSPVWFWTVALVAGLFLAATGALLIGDLTMPARFIRIFTRPQWKSWLVRGAFIILGYGVVLAVAFFAGLGGANPAWLSPLAAAGMALGFLTAVYTAFLFAQAKGRDLWQNPLLPAHLALQAAVAGAASLLLMGLAMPLPTGAGPALRWTLVASVLVHGLLGLSDAWVPHTSHDAALAARNMTNGPFKGFFWGGLVVGVLLPSVVLLLGDASTQMAVASLAALAGLMAYEHAYVQAGQSVPLA